jgi:hypothetical protein
MCGRAIKDRKGVGVQSITTTTTTTLCINQRNNNTKIMKRFEIDYHTRRADFLKGGFLHLLVFAVALAATSSNCFSATK